MEFLRAEGTDYLNGLHDTKECKQQAFSHDQVYDSVGHAYGIGTVHGCFLQGDVVFEDNVPHDCVEKVDGRQEKHRFGHVH